MPTNDMAALVTRGYDRVADRYERLELSQRAWPRMRWLERLLDGIPDGARVLDVGCGNGLPATRRIAERHDATGIDISAEQVERARRNVPSGRFVHGDLLEQAGFRLLASHVETQFEGDHDVDYLWVLAERR